MNYDNNLPPQLAYDSSFNDERCIVCNKLSCKHDELSFEEKVELAMENEENQSQL